MNYKPSISMRVRLNDAGMQTINGISSHAMYKQELDMTITEVSYVLVSNQVWGIEMNQPLITQFLISNLDVDEIGNTYDAEI